jgi:nucleotidyltransferase substrate binding protein (TIGR01987 family)
MSDPMNTKDVRWRQRFQNFKKAFAQLSMGVRAARERELNELEQQGLIQAFEFTHELAWNTLKDFLELNGATNLFGSVNTTRAAFAAGLIENGEAWMEMIKSRNLTTHTYDQTIADKVSAVILSSYAAEFLKFQEKFFDLEKENS